MLIFVFPKRGIIRIIISILYFIAIIYFLATGCKKKHDRNCVTFRQGYAIAVSGKDSGNTNEDIKLQVSFSVMNGCGQFERFEEIREATSRRITIVARHTGCLCTQNIPVRETEYVFRATKTGTYYLQFAGPESTYVYDTLVVR